MLAAELRQQGITSDKISAPHDEQRSIDEALALCAPGDLLIIFGDNIARCWKQIVRFREQSQPGGSQRGTVQSQVGSLTGNASSTSSASSASSASSTPAAQARTDLQVPPQPPARTGPSGEGFVEDTRGVRLARPQEAED